MGRKRPETTKFLSHVLRSSLAGSCYASEVSVDPCTSYGKRVDFMQFIPWNTMSVSGIEKGIFVCYEVKSCLEDIYSGNGLNFLGEKNYLVMTMDCYKQFLPDLRSKEFVNYLHDNYPESSDYFGIKVAIPAGSTVEDEFENPTPVPSNEAEWWEWTLATILPCREGPRRRSVSELMFCMLRSGK